MLLNKGEVITVRYNGIEKTVAKGGKIDVRDFDISTGQRQPLKELIAPVEKKILNKYPGQFEVVETVDDAKIADEYKGVIEALKDKVIGLEAKIAELKAVNDANAQKIGQQGEEINGFGAKEAGYKREIEALQAKLKDQDEENQAVLKRVRGGK